MLEGYCKVFKKEKPEVERYDDGNEVDDDRKQQLPTGRHFVNSQLLMFPSRNCWILRMLHIVAE